MSPLSATVTQIPTISAVAAEAWDACAGSDNPFVSHAFLRLLEDTGCVSAQTGWTPCHLVARAAGMVDGVVPVYLKAHSYGEFVFDHGWANAFERAGGRYYPKLQVAVPFTPVTGPRLLIRPGAPEATTALLTDGLVALAKELGVSSVHVTFPTESEWEQFGHEGWLLRTGQQYHWQNRAYTSFEGFLNDLSSRKRKQIRRERRAVMEAGVSFAALSGGDLKPSHWDAFYRFYMDTAGRKWGSPYLNRAFFHGLGDVLADRVLLILGRQHEDWVCGALNLIGDDALFGRNWGTVVDVPFLHFEACYYQAMDAAISLGLKRVEAGAQGEHKIPRGYQPTQVHSAHWIAHPGLRRAVAEYLEREREVIAHDINTLTKLSPFRSTSDDEDKPTPGPAGVPW